MRFGEDRLPVGAAAALHGRGRWTAGTHFRVAAAGLALCAGRAAAVTATAITMPLMSLMVGCDSLDGEGDNSHPHQGFDLNPLWKYPPAVGGSTCWVYGSKPRGCPAMTTDRA